MIKIEKILFPTDYSKHSNDSIEYAIAFTRAFKVQMYIMHVVELSTKDPENPLYKKPELDQYTDVRDFVKASTKSQVDKSRVNTDKFTYQEINVMGLNAGRKIVDVAAEKGIDLIVMASHGSGFFERLLLGSTTELVVKNANCPVLVIKKEEREFVDFDTDTIKLKKILCPVDFSESSARMVKYASFLARKLNARIYLMHVIEEMFEAIDFLLEHFTVDEFEKKREEFAKKNLLKLAEENIDKDVEFEKVILHGNPRKHIPEFAKDKSIDLITIGAYGKGAEEGIVFSGSIMLKIVKSADCPVLVVR